MRTTIWGMCIKKGQLREAVECYRRALKLDPAQPTIHNNLGLALEGLGQSEDAAARYREAIRLKPDYCEAHSNLGAAYKTQGKLLEAIESGKQAIALNPGHARTLLNMGNAYAELGTGRGVPPLTERELVRIPLLYTTVSNDTGVPV